VQGYKNFWKFLCYLQYTFGVALMPENQAKITFGADPEFFIVNKNDGLIPSWELGITGEKGNPNPIPGMREGAGILCDGVAIEINIPPEPTLSGLSKSVKNALSAFLVTNKAVQAKKGVIGWGMHHIEVPRKYHAHPLYRTVGCSSDLDAYSESGERTPFCAEDFGTMRFSGGHLHVGCDPWPEWLPKNAFIRLLDVAYFSLQDGQRNPPRSDFYGMPGIWRETPYGVEYRSPNTGWLRWGGGLVDMNQSVERILRLKNDSAKDKLINFYNSGIIENFQYKFLRGLNYFSVVSEARSQLNNVCQDRNFVQRLRPTRLKSDNNESLKDPDAVMPLRVRPPAREPRAITENDTVTATWLLARGARFEFSNVLGDGRPEIHYAGTHGPTGRVYLTIDDIWDFSFEPDGSNASGLIRNVRDMGNMSPRPEWVFYTGLEAPTPPPEQDDGEEYDQEDDEEDEEEEEEEELNDLGAPRGHEGYAIIEPTHLPPLTLGEEPPTIGDRLHLAREAQARARNYEEWFVQRQIIEELTLGLQRNRQNG
jgi:hypothetical protein